VASDQRNPDLPDTTKKKVRLAKPHTSGIIIPRWWRGNLALIIGAVAVASVIFAAYTLNQASDRVTQAQKTTTAPSEGTQSDDIWRKSENSPVVLPKDAVAHLFPDTDEMESGQPVRAYEEALPGDLYEDAPVISDATGPRVMVPEEYVPELEEHTPTPESTDLASSQETTALVEDEQEVQEASLPSVDRNPVTASEEPVTEGKPLPFEEELPTQQAWLANAIPFSLADENMPLIAIVIDDMGVDRRRSPRAIALPGPLTMSFLTYARDLGSQTSAALEAGHELMIHVPMEPGSSTVDPGPNVLRVADGIGQTLENLRWGLNQFDGYVGLNNHMGSKFTQDPTGMRAVMEEVKARGLLFLDSRTAGGSVGAKLAAEVGVPFATRNVFLDHVDDEEEVRMRLAQTERLARKNGAAIAIGHPHDATLNVLEEWLPEVEERGFLLAPMSAVVKRIWLQQQ